MERLLYLIPFIFKRETTPGTLVNGQPASQPDGYQLLIRRVVGLTSLSAASRLYWLMQGNGKAPTVRGESAANKTEISQQPTIKLTVKYC